MAVAYTPEDCVWVSMYLCDAPPYCYYYSNCFLSEYSHDLSDCPFPFQHLGINCNGEIRVAVLVPRQYLLEQIQAEVSYYYSNHNHNSHGVVVKRDWQESHMFVCWCFSLSTEPGTIQFEKEINSVS